MRHNSEPGWMFWANCQRTFCNRAVASSSAMRWCRTHSFSEREIKGATTSPSLHVPFSPQDPFSSRILYP